MADDVKIVYSNEADVQTLAEIPGPLYVEILGLRTVQPTGSFTYDNVIKEGETFDILMWVAFRDVLSQLQVNFNAQVNVLNMSTGDHSTSYSFEVNDQLPGGGVRQMMLRQTFTANEEGVFLMSGSLGFPTSRLFDFTLGSFAGSAPPIPAPQTLRVANFYVYP